MTAQTAIVREAANFMVEISPVAELPEAMQEIIQKVRSGLLPKSAAVAYLEQTMWRDLIDWTAGNTAIAHELKGWNNI